MSEFLVLQHIACENLGTIEPAISRRGIGHRYLKLFDGEPVPRDIERYAGLIILGGPMNVYEEDKYPYLKDEDILIKRMMERGNPILGICLGSQLIAKASDAKVTKGERKEIGWYEINMTIADKGASLFKSFPDELMVFQWHGDTFDIPESATHLAASALFPNQAFQIGNNCIGLQFHLEVTEKMIRQWIAEYQKELSFLDYIDTEKIISDTNKYIANLTLHAGLFYDQFFSASR